VKRANLLVILGKNSKGKNSEVLNVLQLSQDEKSLLFNNEVRSDDLVDDEVLQIILDDIQQPIDGKLLPYAPVMANILKSWIS